MLVFPNLLGSVIPACDRGGTSGKDAFHHGSPMTPEQRGQGWNASLPKSDLHILAQLNIPISQVDEMFPTVVLVQAETDLHERTPLGPLGFADEVQAGFLRGSIGLERIALDAGADDVLPTGWTASVTRDDMVQI